MSYHSLYDTPTFLPNLELNRYPNTLRDQLSYLQELHHYRIQCDSLAGYIRRKVASQSYSASSTNPHPDDCGDACDEILPSCMLNKAPPSKPPHIHRVLPSFLPLSDDLISSLQDRGQTSTHRHHHHQFHHYHGQQQHYSAPPPSSPPLTNEQPIPTTPFLSPSHLQSTLAVRTMYWILHIFFITLLLFIDHTAYYTSLSSSGRIAIILLLVITFYTYFLTMATHPGGIIHDHLVGKDGVDAKATISHPNTANQEGLPSFQNLDDLGNQWRYNIVMRSRGAHRQQLEVTHLDQPPSSVSCVSDQGGNQTTTEQEGIDGRLNNVSHEDDEYTYTPPYAMLITKPFVYPTNDQIRQNIRSHFHNIHLGSLYHMERPHHQQPSQDIPYYNYNSLHAYNKLDIHLLVNLLSQTTLCQPDARYTAPSDASTTSIPPEDTTRTTPSTTPPCMSPTTLYLLSLIILHPQYCPLCGHIRPPLSKHCYKEGACYARFDHTCTFLGTTIAGNNHPYFLLLLLLEWWVLFAGVYLLLHSLPDQFSYGTSLYHIGCYLLNRCPTYIMDHIPQSTTESIQRGVLSLHHRVIPLTPFFHSPPPTVSGDELYRYNITSLKWIVYIALILFMVVMILFVTLLSVLHAFMAMTGSTTNSMFTNDKDSDGTPNLDFIASGLSRSPPPYHGGTTYAGLPSSLSSFLSSFLGIPVHGNNCGGDHDDDGDGGDNDNDNDLDHSSPPPRNWSDNLPYWIQFMCKYSIPSTTSHNHTGKESDHGKSIIKVPTRAYLPSSPPPPPSLKPLPFCMTPFDISSFLQKQLAWAAHSNIPQASNPHHTHSYHGRIPQAAAHGPSSFVSDNISIIFLMLCSVRLFFHYVYRTWDAIGFIFSLCKRASTSHGYEPVKVTEDDE